MTGGGGADGSRAVPAGGRTGRGWWRRPGLPWVETPPRTRVGAYVVCVRDGSVLLTRFTRSARWSLPGGGLDHGERPEDGAVREVEEETGYRVVLGALLGVHSALWAGGEVHALQILYVGRVVGGELRHEVGGSSDRAEWVPLATVPTLARTSIVDTGLAAAGT